MGEEGEEAPSQPRINSTEKPSRGGGGGSRNSGGREGGKGWEEEEEEVYYCPDEIKRR